MRFYFLLVFCILLVSCGGPKPLVGTYHDKPLMFMVNKPLADVWPATVDYIVKSGVPVKVADRPSGVVFTEGFDFLGNNQRNERKNKIIPGALYTYEIDGKPYNAKAWVVLNKLVSGKLYPIMIKGDFSVRLKEVGNQTEVSVLIRNLKAESNNSRDKWRYYKIASTGVFENELQKALTN